MLRSGIVPDSCRISNILSHDLMPEPFRNEDTLVYKIIHFVVTAHFGSQVFFF